MPNRCARAEVAGCVAMVMMREDGTLPDAWMALYMLRLLVICRFLILATKCPLLGSRLMMPWAHSSSRALRTVTRLT